MIVNKYINGGGGGSGERGPQGYQGPIGPQGPQGADGLDGKDGKDGADGKDGLDGQTGPQGPQGVEGQVGPQGPQGPAGSGGTGDNFILKSSSGTPENIGAGDVFATHEEASGAIYGNDWTDTGYQTLDFESVLGYHPQAIRVAYTEWVQFSLSFGCEGWNGGITFNIENGAFNVSSVNPGEWNISATHLELAEESWLKKAGETLYLDLVGEYFYIYTDGAGKILLYSVNENMMNNVYVGEVIPAHGDIDKVFQTSIKSEPNVKIELEGNARVDGTLDNPTQIVTMGDGQMKISFYDASNWVGNVCDLESYGAYFHLYYDVSTDGWTLYDSDEESALIKLQDGESGSADFGDGNVYLSYSDGVLTAYTDNEKGWKNWDMGDSHTVVISNELAKISDLPTKKQLVPDFDKNDDQGKVLAVNQWDAIGMSWSDTGDVVHDGLTRFEGYNDGENGKVLTIKNPWIVEWKHPDMVTTEAVEELPVETKDGNMFALANASGYGIYQAQSAHTGYNWFNLEDKTIPQGSITKVRVPYDDSGESNICHIKTDPNGEGDMNLYWHPENSDNRYWDIGDPNGISQYNDEFSLTDYWGNSVVAVKVGDYIEVTFGAPIYQGGEEQIHTYRNTEVYTEGAIADYRRVAFYDEIGGGGSGSQGPQGPQGPAGQDGIDQEPSILKAVSELPESADTGDVVAYAQTDSLVVVNGDFTHGSENTDWNVLDMNNTAGVQQVVLATYLAGDFNETFYFGIWWDSGNSEWNVAIGRNEDLSDNISNQTITAIEGADNSEVIVISTYYNSFNIFSIDNHDGTWSLVADGDLTTDGDINLIELEASTSVSLRQYDGTNWNEIGGGSGSGSTGPQGPQGADGAQGPQGPAGQNGSQGTQGATGAQGPQGPAGSGGGGSSYISDLQPLGINILEGNGVGYGDYPQNPREYWTIEFDNFPGAYLNKYTDDGQGGWQQEESHSIAMKNEYDNVLAAGVYDTDTDKVIKFDTENDSDDLAIGTYEEGYMAEMQFEKERSIVTSVNIKRIVKITESDYETLVNNLEVDEDTFYIVVADDGPSESEP